MSRLLLAELNRLRSRRLTWVALILVALALALLQVAVYQSVKPLTSAEIAEGKSQFEQAQVDYEQNKERYQADEKDCLNQGLSQEDCSLVPRVENYSYRTPTPFPDMAKLAVTFSVYLTALAALFVGASFIGAEYSSGALANWLSFIPERGKVFAAKLVALLLGAAVLSAAASAVTLGAAMAAARGAGAQVSGLSTAAALGGRGVGIALIFAVIGFALALVTRHTIAAAGTMLAYLFVSFVLTALVEVIAGLQRLKPLLPQNNLSAFLDYGYTYSNYGGEMTDEGVAETVVQHTISFGDSLVYWVVVLAVLVAGSYIIFRRRDVN